MGKVAELSLIFFINENYTIDLVVGGVKMYSWNSHWR